MAPHDKELSEDLRIRIMTLHKDGLGLKKFGNSLGLSYRGQGHSEVFQDGLHSEQADQRSWVHSMLNVHFSKNCLKIAQLSILRWS